MEVFEKSNYDDDVVKQKLDEKLAYKQEIKKTKKYQPSMNKSKTSHKKSNYNYYNSKNSHNNNLNKKKYYGKNYQGHYKKGKNTPKYTTEIVELDDIVDLSKKDEEVKNNKENEESKQESRKYSEIEFGDLKKELCDIDEDDKVTTTATTSNKGMDLLSQTSTNDFKVAEEKKNEE